MAALGLLILVAAAVVAVVGGLANSGADHALTNFSFFGADLDISSGRLLIYGVILGAIGMLGLNLLLAGTNRSVKHRMQTRRDLKDTKARNAELEEERIRMEKQQAMADRNNAIDLDERRNIAEADTTGTGTTDAPTGNRFRS